MTRNSDRYQALLSRLKKIPGVAYLLVAATLVIALASFLDATSTILKFFTGTEISHNADTSSGGLIQPARTPADHYHNARVYDLNGDTRNAKRSYDAYFQSHQEFVDPHLYFQELLKNTDGLSAAQSYYDGLLAKSPDSVLYKFLTARLQDSEARVLRYKQLLAEHPKYVPVLFALGDEYSMKVVGRQTLDEQRLEFDYLKAIDEAGDAVFGYYLDKKEAIRLIDDSKSRFLLAKQFNAKRIDEYIEVSTETYGENEVSIDVSPNEIVTGLWYKLPGMTDFKSSGSSFADAPNGKKWANTSIEAGKIPPGTHTITVKYENEKGNIVGPLDLQFVVLSKAVQDANNFIQFQWSSPYAKRLRVRRYDNNANFDVGWGNNEEMLTNVTYTIGNGTPQFWIKDGKVVLRSDSQSLEIPLTAFPPGTSDITMRVEFANGKHAMLRYRFVMPTDDDWHDLDVVEVTDP